MNTKRHARCRNQYCFHNEPFFKWQNKFVEKSPHESLPTCWRHPHWGRSRWCCPNEGHCWRMARHWSQECFSCPPVANLVQIHRKILTSIAQFSEKQRAKPVHFGCMCTTAFEFSLQRSHEVWCSSIIYFIYPFIQCTRVGNDRLGDLHGVLSVLR